MWFRVEGDMKGTCGIHSFLFPYHFELIHWFQPHAPKNLYAAGFDGLKRDAWLGDFAFMRAASHIAISPGTFAWWGAFLGQAARVYMPIIPGEAVLPWCHLFPKLMDGTYLFYDAWNKEFFHSASEAAARCGALQGKQNPTRLAPMQLVERLYPEVLAHLQDIGGTQHLQKFGFNGTVTSTAANPKESMGKAANLPAVNHFLVIYSITFHCLKTRFEVSQHQYFSQKGSLRLISNGFPISRRWRKSRKIGSLYVMDQSRQWAIQFVLLCMVLSLQSG